MNEFGTMHTGPLGSTIHVLRADAETIAELAAVDWNRHFRRVCLDPVRGFITLMSPSRLHEDLASIFDDIVGVAASDLAGAARKLRSPRLRGRGEPPGQGWSPIARSTSASGPGAISKRSVKGARRPTPSSIAPHPTLWSKPKSRAPMQARPNATARWECGSCGDCTGARAPMSCGWSSWRCIPAVHHASSIASEVLEGLTPDDVCEAVEGVRFSLTDEECREAVARVVRRRQRTSVRVREEGAAYTPSRTAGSARWSFPGAGMARLDGVVSSSAVSRRRTDLSSARTHARSVRVAATS